MKCLDQGEQKEAESLLELLEKQMKLEEEKDEQKEEEGSPAVSTGTPYEPETQVELSELEEEELREEEIRRLHEQSCLLQQVEILKITHL